MIRPQQDSGPYRPPLTPQPTALKTHYITSNIENTFTSRLHQEKAFVQSFECYVRKIRRNRATGIRIGTSPQVAFISIWKGLDKCYHTPNEPTKLLLQQLTNSPSVKANDTATLFSFHVHCH